MSGLEIAVSVLALVEAAISLTRILHEGYTKQKGLLDVCQRLQRRLETIRTIVWLVRDEKDLQTPSVVDRLRELKLVGKRIKLTLQSINPQEKGPARLFFHQLISGSEDEKKINEIISDLEGEKTALILVIQVVGVGLKKDSGDNFTFIPSASARRIDGFLRNDLHIQSGLRLMRITEDRASDGNVPLTDKDMESMLADMQLTVKDDNPATERIIINNVAKFQATQINAPLGEDVWAEVRRLVIEDNTADAMSTQINYPMTLKAFCTGMIPQLAFLIFISYILYFPLSYYF
ncbi:uncharacterized protein FFB20_13570 [Fusarium fujikuroi]|nr:Uncharacterized protein Y057_8453 [Fusarium fujikuroi]SCO10570.1 uncharacterized protein FFB20_13570 [Fusarium fujikuroi]SCO23914.1 uncharacterized protein FFE2_15805 [Fusarium fujikuroi]SCO25785.1 uncharacterized protein FFC1_15710 [Fusarium fujikuroi]